MSLLDDEGTEERTHARTDGSAAADVRIPYSGKERGRESVVTRNWGRGNQQLSVLVLLSPSSSLCHPVPSPLYVIHLIDQLSRCAAGACVAGRAVVDL